MRNPVLYILFLPGVGLLVVSTWIPVSYLYKNIYWTETEAEIIGLVQKNEETVYHVMRFSDASGIVHEIQHDTDNDFSQGKDERHALVLYDPENPQRYDVKNPGKFMIAIFFPLGLLCAYFGWPWSRKISNQQPVTSDQ